MEEFVGLVRYVIETLTSWKLYSDDETSVSVGWPGEEKALHPNNAALALALILRRAMLKDGDLKAVHYVGQKLMYTLPPANIPEDFFSIPVGNPEKPSFRVETFNTTTYTLGLMLMGALSQLES